jgi:uncharacterized membrane protein
MMNWGGRFGDGAGIWWLFGLLCMVVLVGALVWLIVAVMRGPRHPQMPQQPWQPPYGATPPASQYPARQTPQEILRERLARGEVSVEDYQRTLAALGPEAPQPTPPQGPVPPPSF